MDCHLIHPTSDEPGTICYLMWEIRTLIKKLLLEGNHIIRKWRSQHSSRAHWPPNQLLCHSTFKLFQYTQQLEPKGKLQLGFCTLVSAITHTQKSSKQQWPDEPCQWPDEPHSSFYNWWHLRIMVNSLKLWSQTTWVQTSTLPFIGCMAVGKLSNFSIPQFSHL